MFYCFKKLLRKVKKIKKQRHNKLQNKLISDIKNNVASCGENLQVFGSMPEISHHNRLTIGNDCRFNSGVFINAWSGVTLGNDVTLSHGAKIISTGYDVDHWIHTGEKNHLNDSPIYIGNHCWIGANAIILPGVKITGEYVVIGAGAVVTKNITENKVVVAGVPAKIIKQYE